MGNSLKSEVQSAEQRYLRVKKAVNGNSALNLDESKYLIRRRIIKSESRYNGWMIVAVEIRSLIYD